MIRTPAAIRNAALAVPRRAARQTASGTRLIARTLARRAPYSAAASAGPGSAGATREHMNVKNKAVIPPLFYLSMGLLGFALGSSGFALWDRSVVPPHTPEAMAEMQADASMRAVPLQQAYRAPSAETKAGSK
ncbi:hypothetical protein GGF32_000515 [Allomyces javanicus]|nr:hypothetical protein GGF32_003851 [Allomyces javanicus]KAJ3358281.1 hypothetical protein GGF32_000515 [Allomyces javanicus]